MERGDIPSSCRVHNSLSGLLAKGRLKVLAIVLTKEIAGNGLTTILVDSLKDLVAGSIAQTGEQRDELAADGGRSVLPEDDLVQLARVGNLRRVTVSDATVRRNTGNRTYSGLVAHKTLGNGINLIDNQQVELCLSNRSRFVRDGRWQARQYQQNLLRHGQSQSSRKMSLLFTGAKKASQVGLLLLACRSGGRHGC